MVQDTIIRDLIEKEESNLFNITSPSVAIGVIYNLIYLKLKYESTPQIYVLYKMLIEQYIQVISTSPYGYDNFNTERLEGILKNFKCEEQHALLQFTISRISHELPELDKSWFLERKNIAEIKAIIKKKELASIFKIVSLFAGLNIKTLLLTISFIFLIVYLFTLPLSEPTNALFILEYELYSDNKYFNHLLNLLTIFVDLDNDFKIKPLNGLGTFLIIFSKAFFVLVIANYLYIKVTDKLTS